ncbi:hypothetical protein QFZ66_000366 [Streptomyces sp. B4I13]|uniref:hypothetical protein n=1 Tax=Streptomyces sp. B4I13 TaxID=3042271 RepID=UPI00277EA163|nr:hypothetical protein [Streptomyces sp. B4I13]MDQ0956488.1 hypothetical protein [Streptomyces sp. B4I13]
MTRIRDHRTVLHRARVATSLAFLAFGTALGAWTSRIPAIKQRLDLGDGQLAVGLLACPPDRGGRARAARTRA